MNSRAKIGLVILLAGVTLTAGYGLAAYTGLVDDPTGIFGADQDQHDHDDIYTAVPEQSNVVALADPVGFLTDPVTRDVGNYIIQEELGLNQSYSRLTENLSQDLSGPQTDANISATDLGKVVVFGEVSDSVGYSQGEDLNVSAGQSQQTLTNISEQYVGVVFELRATESELDALYGLSQNATGDQTTVTKHSYKGHTIYTANSTTAAVDSVSFGVLSLEDGLHVAGREEVVEDSIDAYEGDAGHVSHELLPESGENTYLSVGTSNIDDNLTEENPTPKSIVASYSTDGDDTAILSARINFDSVADATQYSDDVLEGALNQREGTPFLEDVDIEVLDSAVTLTYEASTDQINSSINDTAQALQNVSFAPTTTSTDNGSDYTTPAYNQSEPEVNISRNDDTLSFTLQESGEYFAFYMRQDGEELASRTDRVRFEGDTYTVSAQQYNATSPVEIVGVKFDDDYNEVTEVITVVEPPTESTTASRSRASASAGG